MRSLFLFLLFSTFFFRGNAQIQYDSLFALNLKKEIKGLHINDKNDVWFYTYHHVHEFDLANNSEVIYPVEDDTVYQYLFDNALRNSDYNVRISQDGQSVVYVVDRRNLFWFLKKNDKYTLFKHIDLNDQYASDFTHIAFVNKRKLITGGPYGKIRTYTKLNNEVIEDTLSINDSGAIYSMAVSKSGHMLSVGTGSSTYITYDLVGDSILNSVSLDNFQRYCDGIWCTQIPVKVNISPDESKMVFMIANKMKSIIVSSITGGFREIFRTQQFKAIDFCLSNNHCFILDQENKIHIMNFQYKRVSEIVSSRNRPNFNQKILVSADESYLIRYDQFGHIEVMKMTGN